MTTDLDSALKAFALSYDLVGPTVDDDISRAISRYGKEAVKAAFARLTKPKRGRKPEKDWNALRPVIEADAHDWLSGGDPFATRTNYSIAKQLADKSPGHSHPATMRRIQDKLSKKREIMTLCAALGFCDDGYPYTAKIRLLRALCDAAPDMLWPQLLERAIITVADYQAKFGHAPPVNMTMNEVQNTTRNALLSLADLGSRSRVGAGLLEQYASPPALARD